MSKVNRIAFLLNIAIHCWRQISDIWSAPDQQVLCTHRGGEVTQKVERKKSRVNIEQIEVIPQKRNWQNSETKKNNWTNLSFSCKGHSTWVELRTGNGDNMKILPMLFRANYNVRSLFPPLVPSSSKLKYFFAWLTSLEMHPTTCKIIKDGAQPSLI